jgi:uncharacterized membrane protein YfcA
MILAAGQSGCASRQTGARQQAAQDAGCALVLVGIAGLSQCAKRIRPTDEGHVMASPDVLVFACLVLVLAGTVKGFVGLGLPAVATALLSLLLEPRVAISLILWPMLLTNLWQMIRGPYLRDILARYWWFGLVLAIMVSLTVWVSRDTSNDVLRFVLGLSVLVFVLLNWRNLLPPLPDPLSRLAEAGLAMGTGILGGLTAAWAVPLVIFLSGRRLAPPEFVQTLGFLIAAGSVPLLLSYSLVGFADWTSTFVSLGLVPPALLGFAIGEALRRRLDPHLFRMVFLIVFAFVGLGLIYGSFKAWS